MIDLINNFEGGLDLDSGLLKVGKGSYINALNVTRDAVSGSNDKDFTNYVGNQLRNYSLPRGVNVVIGAYGFTLRNTIIYFVFNYNDRHSILQYSHTTKTVTKIYENITDSGGEDILGFTINGRITSVSVFPRQQGEGDLLIFLDSLGRPVIMNIQRFIDGEYTPVTRDIIDFAKRAPLSPPTCVYANDSTNQVNNTRNKLFRFAYRWVFDDFEKSTISPISAVPLPDNILDDTFTNVSTNNNQITVSINTGPKNVAKIELLVSVSDKTNIWSDFGLVDSIDKSKENYSDDEDIAYLFYNDATYPVIPVVETGLLFDYVPDKANAMCMPNGNVVMFSGITEGYDNDLEANVVVSIEQTEAGEGITTGSLNVTVSRPNPGLVIFRFSGIPPTGTQIDVVFNNLNTMMPETVATYTTIAGDTVPNINVGISQSAQSNGFLSFTGSGVNIFFDSDDYSYNTITITLPSVDANDNSIATWKWSTQRKLGIAYYSQCGKTNGVVYTTGITFPDYEETGGGAVLVPYINAKIYHRPPIWAYSYQWLVTKEPTQYLFFECVDVNTSEDDFLYFDISNLPINQQRNPTTAAVVSWTFQDGDRMRLIKRDSDDTVFDYTYDAAIDGILTDPVINNVATTGRFIKIRDVAPFSSVDYTSNFFIIELYRPGQQEATAENQVYYEMGVQYPVINPTTDERVHGGEVTNQSEDLLVPAEVNIYEGDSYFRVRTVYLSETGQGSFFCQDRNFVDFYISAVSSVDGRPLAIEVNAKEAYYAATWRHGQEYQANTSINNLNRFYPADTADLDISYGDIMRTEVNDRKVWVFQKFKIGQLPIFSQINREPNGTVLNVVTSQLINPVDYYAGNWGIGTASTSLVIFNYVAYFCDNINGAILRLSRDGITPISIIYNVNSWANKNIPLRKNPSFILGGYDQRLNNYIVALEQSLVDGAMEVGVQRNFVYSGVYSGGTNDINVCAGARTTYYHGVPFAVGIVLYIDRDLTIPLTSFNYVATSDGTIYSISSSTGIVGEATGGICQTGIPGSYKVGTDSGTVCLGSSVTLYTESAFGIGVILYTDINLTIPLTTYTFVVSGGDIYTVDPDTGEVLTNTGNSCSSSPSQGIISSGSSPLITGIKFNSIPATYVSGTNFPIASLQFGYFSTTQVGLSVTVTITVTGVADITPLYVKFTDSDGTQHSLLYTTSGDYTFNNMLITPEDGWNVQL
ncbi:MAG TPA: hypothetical protein PKV73_01085 [Agriterribacter sp.]|nr:hypothetical protein [Agriterribacter sp.]